MKIFSWFNDKDDTELSYSDTVQTWLNGNSKKAKFTKKTLEKTQYSNFSVITIITTGPYE